MAENRPVYLACQPSDPLRRAHAEEKWNAKLPEYKSIARDICSWCNAEILLGPNQQQAHSQQPAAALLCLDCAAQLLSVRPDTEIRSLESESA